MSDPWMKFYTSDWRSDPRLKMCSPGARGMWIEMICLMHEATPYGHLLIHGQPPNEAQLASLTGIPSAELHDLVAELERFGVFSRTKEGVIYSRKLVRMASEAAKARKNGKRGGNPSLRKHDEKTGSLNPPDKDCDKPQKPDTRIQNPERKKDPPPPPKGGERAILCEVMSEKAADDFIAHRKAKRAKLTERAAQIIADSLRGHHDPDAVVRMSVMNGWTGIFPDRAPKPPQQARLYDLTKYTG